MGTFYEKMGNGFRRTTLVAEAILMKHRRFDDKPVDRQTFRRHGSDVSTTHFVRFDDNLWTFRRQICVNVELLI